MESEDILREGMKCSRGERRGRGNGMGCRSEVRRGELGVKHS